MPFIESDLVKFIVLVIPGIFGMRVYKPFVYRGTDREHEHQDMVIALILGVFGYLGALRFSAWCGLENDLVMNFGFSCATTIVIAIFFGYLSRHCPALAFLPAKLDSACTGFLEDAPQDHVLELIYKRELQTEKDYKDRVRVAKVYAINNPENAQIGQVCQWSFDHNELAIDCYPHLTTDFFDKHRKYITVWMKAINLDNGIVIEIASVEKRLVDVKRSLEFRRQSRGG